MTPTRRGAPMTGSTVATRRKRPASKASPARTLSPAALRCRREFLRFFRGGFADETYIDWERGYKWQAHERWTEHLGSDAYRTLLDRGRYAEVAEHAVRIESRTNLLFSFEKMALRDAVKSPAGAQRLAAGLFAVLHGPGGDRRRFEGWGETIAAVPPPPKAVPTRAVVPVFRFLGPPQGQNL